MNTPGEFDRFDSVGYTSTTSQPDQTMSPKGVSSRLAKKQQKRLARQTWLIGIVTVVFAIVFALFIVPNVIRLGADFLGSDGSLSVGDTTPPQIPTISQPVAATPSASLRVQGFGEAGSTAVFVVNSSQVEEVVIGDEGDFETTIDLDEGENVLNIFAKDEAGNESGTSKSHIIVYDPVPPELELTEPVDGQTYELRKNQTITVQGTTEPKAKVSLNARPVLTKADGTFRTTYQLAEGDNELKFVVVDQAGNTTEQIVKVTFRY